MTIAISTQNAEPWKDYRSKEVEAWLQIFEGSTKKRIEYCKDKDGIHELFKDTLVVFQSSQN